MAAVPVVRTWTAGEVVTAAYMNNNIRDVDSWLLASAICQVRNTAATSIPNAANTAVPYDAEDVDSTGMHSTVSNTSRITAVYPGYYQQSACNSFGTSAAGRRGGRYAVNGTAVTGSNVWYASAGFSGVALRTMLIFLNVGDYIEVQAFQDSGGALAMDNGGTDRQSNSTTQWRSN